MKSNGSGFEPVSFTKDGCFHKRMEFTRVFANFLNSAVLFARKNKKNAAMTSAHQKFNDKKGKYWGYVRYGIIQIPFPLTSKESK